MAPQRRRGRKRLLLTAALICAGLTSAALPNRSYGGAFPGTNGLIAFYRVAPGPDPVPGDIYAVEPNDPSSLTNLTNSNGSDDFQPNWSPDGTRVVFASNGGSGGSNYHLWVMNADGSDPTPLTSDDAFVETNPSWSPDATQIAFERRPNASGSTTDVWRMDAAPGSVPSEVSLIIDGCAETEPAWGTNGLIALTSFRGSAEFCSTNSNIVAYDPASDTRTALAANSDHHERSPSWSPDSNSLVYEADEIGGADNPDIFVKEDADGPSDGVKVTDFGFIQGGAAVQPAWSPDGTKITFAAKGDGSTDLFDVYTMNRSGSGQTKITDVGGSNDFNDIHPDWQPIPVTVPEQPPAAFTPSVSVNPSVVRQGFVVQASGSGFAPGATVLLSLSGGISNRKSVTVDSAGNFRIPILIYPRDALGGRILTATRGTGPVFSTVSDTFLVVPGSLQPSDFVVRN